MAPPAHRRQAGSYRSGISTQPDGYARCDSPAASSGAATAGRDRGAGPRPSWASTTSTPPSLRPAHTNEIHRGALPYHHLHIATKVGIVATRRALGCPPATSSLRQQVTTTCAVGSTCSTWSTSDLAGIDDGRRPGHAHPVGALPNCGSRPEPALGSARPAGHWPSPADRPVACVQNFYNIARGGRGGAGQGRSTSRTCVLPLGGFSPLQSDCWTRPPALGDPGHGRPVLAAAALAEHHADPRTSSVTHLRET